MTFTPDNWRTEQTVTVSAGHDADTEDDQVDITHTATSTDSGYNGLDIDSVAVTVYDNDATAGVTISPTALWIEEEVSGFADTYTVRLRTEPTADVAIDISAGEEVTVSPTRLTFTRDNWRAEQTVTVSAGHDADTEDDTVAITHTATSLDSGYHRLDIDSVALTVYDNDMATESTTRQVAAVPTPTPVAAPTATATPTVAPTPRPQPSLRTLPSHPACRNRDRPCWGSQNCEARTCWSGQRRPAATACPWSSCK